MPFENLLEINIKAFFFNSKTDYLPYYKNFSFTLDHDTELKEVLKLIKEKNPDFSYPDEDLIFRVNELMVTGDEKLSEIVEELGNELLIEPALQYRSDNGLILNNHDFLHQYRTLFSRHITNKEDLAHYLTLYPLHYASETFHYNHQYIGDAILLLAHKMIVEDGSEYKEEILEAINDEFNGIRCCEYENNMFKGEDHTNKINELKAMINLKESTSLIDKVSTLTLRKKNHDIDESLEGTNIALYLGDKVSSTITETFKTTAKERNIHVINFSMSTKKAGQSIINDYSELAYVKAGTVLLDALDSGADTLVCSKDSDANYFKSVISHCERELGRDIELKIISLDAFYTLKEKVTEEL
jgi:succinate dehydrogenase/fumarate reductase-like Fe-S protein